MSSKFSRGIRSAQASSAPTSSRALKPRFVSSGSSRRFPPVVHAPFRRALLRRFPYCVFYYLEAEEVVVVGCFHAHRSPEVWRVRAGV
jgi:hypothetical protein